MNDSWKKIISKYYKGETSYEVHDGRSVTTSRNRPDFSEIIIHEDREGVFDKMKLPTNKKLFSELRMAGYKGQITFASAKEKGEWQNKFSFNIEHG